MSGYTSGLYPVMLRLAGKRCVVVGGGPVAERKVSSLLDAGADGIVVISDKLTEGLEQWELAGRIRTLRRHYQEGDLADASLVIAATNDPPVNARIAAEADRLRIWANTADDGESGNLVTPAVVRRGELVIALTTGGASPSLAAKLKRELEQRFGDDYEPRLRALRLLRERVLERGERTGGELSSVMSGKAVRRNLLRAAAEDELGWRAVASLLSDSLNSSEDEEENILVHNRELHAELDRWIERLSGQQA